MTKFLWSLGLGLFFWLAPVFVFASVSGLGFVSSEQVVAPGEISETIIVQTHDGSGAAVAVGQTADVTLESSSETGEFFNDSGEEEEFDPTMAKNWKSRKFRYRDSSEGEHEITVTVTIRDTGESWTAEQDITIGDEPEDESEDDDDEETSGDQDEDEEEDVAEDDSGNDEDEDQVDDDEEEEEDEEEVKEVKKEIKKEEKKKAVPPKAEPKPEEISAELLLKLKMALATQAVPVAPPPVVEPEPEPVKKTEKVEEKPEPITISAETQLAAAIVATNTLPTALSNESVDGPIVIEKKPTLWQRFWRWLFGD